jgi:hypothetical protein
MRTSVLKSSSHASPPPPTVPVPVSLDFVRFVARVDSSSDATASASAARRSRFTATSSSGFASTSSRAVDSFSVVGFRCARAGAARARLAAGLSSDSRSRATCGASEARRERDARVAV